MTQYEDESMNAGLAKFMSTWNFTRQIELFNEGLLPS